MTDQKPSIQIGDETRSMTEQEYASWLSAQDDAQKMSKQIDDQIAAKNSARNKLKALGLTEAEIAALVG